jgi:hypothetical protein
MSNLCIKLLLVHQTTSGYDTKIEFKKIKNAQLQQFCSVPTSLQQQHFNIILVS